MKWYFLSMILVINVLNAWGQSGLHVKWVNEEEVVYYDRSGTVWLHHLASDTRKELLKGSQPAPNPAESGTYAIRKKREGQSAIVIVSTLAKSSIHVTKDVPEDRRAFHPIWSRDGNRLAFHAEYGNNQSTLYLYDYKKQALSSYLEGMTVGAPSFFTNGDVLTTHLTNKGCILIRFDPDSGNVSELFKSEHKIYFSDPSPDGSMITFTYRKSGNLDIWLLNLDSGKLTQLTDTPYDEHSPRWSPAGNQLVYFAEIGGQYPAFLMDINGDNRIRLTR